MSEMTRLDFNVAIKDCKVYCCNALCSDVYIVMRLLWNA